VLSDIKSWRKLQSDTQLDNKAVASRMMACLQAIGRHIEGSVAGRGDADALRSRMWRSISKATHNDRSGEELAVLYAKVVARGQHQQKQ
jgi:hypothetical protein